MSKRKKQEPQEVTSTYPQLSGAIEQLQTQLKSSGNMRQALLEKWLERLIKTETEMRHLERIENLAHALTEREQESDK